MIKDGIALTKFFFWLGKNMGVLNLTESSLADKLTGFRSEQDGFLGPSFSTIVAYNEHGALPHYSATANLMQTLEATRNTPHRLRRPIFHRNNRYYKDNCSWKANTRADQGFYTCAQGQHRSRHGKNTCWHKGIQLDILARKSLWEYGLNYGHGTGHGVGFASMSTKVRRA